MENKYTAVIKKKMPGGSAGLKKYQVSTAKKRRRKNYWKLYALL